MPPAEGLAAVIGGFQGLGGSCPTIGPRRDFLSVEFVMVARWQGVRIFWPYGNDVQRSLENAGGLG